jgi:hypothetical protein
MNKHQSKDSNLTEGLRHADLKSMINNLFTIDQYSSKMGNDKDIIVLRFRAADKEPAIDLMEFIERGYPFVLDADISSGEEKDGNYSIFVEIERSKKAPEQIADLMNGISRLCGEENWRFRWYKDIGGNDFSEETFATVVPLTSVEYEERVSAEDKGEVTDFFDQGATDVEMDESKNLTFKKPYSETLHAKLVAIGDYAVLKEALKGALQLDEASRGQVVYLNKFLGNYDINKIEGHFLVRNGDRAVILAKEKW